ncbi:MAG: Rieske (2Fe-2S) protein [Bacteroidales bacterium]|nr:Rieske (2Fe-2S) protein [Bacteroidales bacterium]
MNRRDLIKSIAAGTVTLFVVPAAFTSCEKDPIDPDDNNNPDDTTLTIDLTAAKYSNLGSAGGFVKEGDIIIINTGDEFIALSNICTHQGCIVSYDPGNNNLPCPCHGSVYSTSGSVLQGPADAPLKKYELSQEGDILTIVL